MLNQLIVIIRLLIHLQQQVVCSVLNQQILHRQQVAYSVLNLLIIHQQVVSLVLNQLITHLHQAACSVLNQHLKLDYSEQSQLQVVVFSARKPLLLIINLVVCSDQLLQQAASLVVQQILLEAYSATQHLQHLVACSEQIHLERVCLTKIRIYSRSHLKKTMMKMRRVKRVKSHHPIMPQRTIKSS